MWNKNGIAISAMAAAFAIATPAMGQLLTIGDIDLKVDVLTTRVEGIEAKQDTAEIERAALLADIGRIDVDLSVLRSDITDNTAAIAINTSLLSDHNTRLTALDGTVVAASDAGPVVDQDDLRDLTFHLEAQAKIVAEGGGGGELSGGDLAGVTPKPERRKGKGKVRS